MKRKSPLEHRKVYISGVPAKPFSVSFNRTATHFAVLLVFIETLKRLKSAYFYSSADQQYCQVGFEKQWYV